MAEQPSQNIEQSQDEAAARKAFIEADRAFAFGPSFFLLHLGRFVRDRCPDAAEQLPLVRFHLADAETIDVCHIVGVSPRWVMVASPDAVAHPDSMAIECVPFPLIHRISIHARRAEGASIGFSQLRPPAIMSAETLLQASMPTHRETA